MMRYWTWALILLIFFGCKSSNTDEELTVSSDELETMITYLASDDLKGRMTGSIGIDSAAKYIEEYFSSNKKLA